VFFKQIFPYTIFPVTIVGALWYTAWGMRSGLDEGTVVFTVLLVSILILAFSERALPYAKDWNQPRGDVLTDTLHMLLTQLTLHRVFDALTLVAMLKGAVWLQAQFNFGLWPHELPVVLQLGLALLITDLPRYWLHRASHQLPFLWRFHAIHHSPQRLYWLNAGRFHPLDELMHTTLATLLLVGLGVGPEVLVMQGVFSSVHGMFQHCNIDLKLGPLNYVFPMAELHRWHHSLDVSESSRNYGNNLAIWDLVFGTYYRPEGRLPSTEIGVADHAIPAGYWGQLLAPARWEAIAKAPPQPETPKPATSPFPFYVPVAPINNSVANSYTLTRLEPPRESADYRQASYR